MDVDLIPSEPQDLNATEASLEPSGDNEHG